MIFYLCPCWPGSALDILVVVWKWERYYNESANGRINPQEIISIWAKAASYRYAEIRAEEFLGYFWPQSVLEREYPDESTRPDADKDEVDIDGVKIEGYFLHARYGCPQGVMRLTRMVAGGTMIKTGLDSSKPSEGQSADRFASSSQSVQRTYQAAAGRIRAPLALAGSGGLTHQPVSERASAKPHLGSSPNKRMRKSTGEASHPTIFLPLSSVHFHSTV